jgi:hypothetical protein
LLLEGPFLHLVVLQDLQVEEADQDGRGPDRDRSYHQDDSKNVSSAAALRHRQFVAANLLDSDEL